MRRYSGWSSLSNRAYALNIEPQTISTHKPLNLWCARQELNLRPTGSKSQPNDPDQPENATNQDVTQA